MLTTDRRYVLMLLQESLGKNTNGEFQGIDNHAIARIIIRNSVLLTVNQKLPLELKRQLYGQYNIAIKQAIIQEYEGERVLRALSNAGFSCIALKGWELRNLYPEPTMRQMADLDILVKPYSFHLIRSVMESSGYSSGKIESTWMHDNFSKNEVHIEMHKRLTDDSDLIQA